MAKAGSSVRRRAVTAAAAAGLVLAAGEGRRFGAPKAIVEIDGERLVDRAIRLLADGGCSPVVVVEGAAPLHIAMATFGVPVHVVANEDWPSGMGSSLRVGLTAVKPEPVAAVVVALVDQPWLGAEAVRRLRSARSGGAFVAVATYGGERGNPVLLGREVWDEIAGMAHGDTGARAWMRAHPELVTAVPCDDTGDPADVDYPDDLA